MGITGTNDLNSTSISYFNLIVYTWAQKNWISCNGPYQHQCTKWSDGYELVDDSKAWVVIASLNIEEMNRSKFIIGWIWSIFALFIFLYFILKNNRSYIFISNLHLILIMFITSNSTYFETKSFLASFFIIKGDFIFVDRFIPLSNKLWLIYEMIADDTQHEFIWKSTVINFIWIEIFMLLFCIVYYAYKYFRFKENFKVVYVRIITSTLFNAIIVLILPFELISMNLEIKFLLHSFSIKQFIFLMIQLTLTIFLSVSRWKHRDKSLSKDKYDLSFTLLFLLQLLMMTTIIANSVHKLIFLLIYVLLIQYMQDKLAFSQIKLLMVLEITNKVMVIILISINLMMEKGLFSEIQQQGVLLITIGVSYMILIYAILLSWILK